MKRILTFILLSVMLSSCFILKRDKVVVNEKTIKFDYFRVANHRKDMTMIDFDGVIWIHKDKLVIKSVSFGSPDKAFIFDRAINMKRSKAWDAHPYGEPQTNVYIEYKKGEYITILYIKQNAAVYFISLDLINTIEPLPKKGVWYTKMN